MLTSCEWAIFNEREKPHKLRIFGIVILNTKYKTPQKLACEKFYVHEKILRTRNFRDKFIKIFFLKNAKKTCKPNNRDLYRDGNRMTLTHWKHLESQYNAFWYCFKVIKQYAFHYMIKLVPGTENQRFFEILQLLDTWRWMLWPNVTVFTEKVLNGKLHFLYIAEGDSMLNRLSAIISPYLDKFIKHTALNTTFLNEVVIIFLNHHGAEISVIWLVEQSAIKLLILIRY